MNRYGIVTRETVSSEAVAGGFSKLYPIFKAMEESGRVRRGYFVAGQGAAQFAAPGAEDRLRDAGAVDQTDYDNVPSIILAATDPANPYGASLPWPHAVPSHEDKQKTPRPQRTPGARVVLKDGCLIGYLSKGRKRLLTFVPLDEPVRTKSIEALVEGLVLLAKSEANLYLGEIVCDASIKPDLDRALQDKGFVRFSDGLQWRADDR